MSNLIDKVLEYANRNKARSNPGPLPYPGCGYQPTIPPMPECSPPKTGSPVSKKNVVMVIKYDAMDNDSRRKTMAQIDKDIVTIENICKVVFVDKTTGQIISEI